jgi:UDP-glucose-4-epimerase GalE
MKVLVTGHKGYIGAIMCKLLREQGAYVIGFDVADTPKEVLADTHLFSNYSTDYLLSVVHSKKIDHIFHFGALASVDQSVHCPSRFYKYNTSWTIDFLHNLYMHGWKGKFIFSSTAAVYGTRGKNVKEDIIKEPCNPYGMSKLMCEYAIQDICKQARIDTAIFRYFNVAGSYDGFGDHLDSGHILPKICTAIQNKKPFVINGDDFDTRDGTCVRDYVHVLDICRAHLHAAEHLKTNPGIHTYNLGSGKGFTNKEIVEAFEKYTGEDVKWKYGPRRPGDPPLLVANNKKFIKQTGFKYEHTNLKDIVTSAWDWHKRNS